MKRHVVLILDSRLNGKETLADFLMRGYLVKSVTPANVSTGGQSTQSREGHFLLVLEIDT